MIDHADETRPDPRSAAHLTSRSVLRTAGLALLLAPLAACSGGGGGSRLSVSARSGATASATSGSLDLGNGILLSEIRMAVRRVALEGAQDGGGGMAMDMGGGGGGGGGDDGGATEAEPGEVKVGPCLVDLAGDQLGAGSTSLAPVCATDVPAGTYEELQVELGPVAPADAGGVAGLAAMDGQSVIVDGTLNGTVFRFQSTLDVEQKTEGAIVVAAGTNVTITLDPTGWFTGPGGAALDPTSPADQGAIEANIRASIRSFEDDDRDGHEDSHGM
jgi:hypothetical protein